MTGVIIAGSVLGYCLIALILGEILYYRVLPDWYVNEEGEPAARRDADDDATMSTVAGVLWPITVGICFVMALFIAVDALVKAANRVIRLERPPKDIRKEAEQIRWQHTERQALKQNNYDEYVEEGQL
jgi:hypothetical protein